MKFLEKFIPQSTPNGMAGTYDTKIASHDPRDIRYTDYPRFLKDFYKERMSIRKKKRRKNMKK